MHVKCRVRGGFPLVKKSRELTVVSLALVVTLLALFAALDEPSPPRVDATSFNPTATATLADSAPGANSDVTLTFDIPAPDSNFDRFLISFMPTQFGVAKDTDIPDGAIVGQITSTVTLGILNAPCNQQLNLSMDLFDATTNPAKQTTFENGFRLGPNELPVAVTAYPDFLTRLFPGLTPISRLYGEVRVAGGGFVRGASFSVNILVFEPGVTIENRPLDPGLGYPVVTVLQNSGDPQVQPAPDAITNICTPFNSKTVYFGVTKDTPSTTANEGGIPYRTNPTQAAVYRFVSWAQSQRDADNDGIENSLDTCPLTANVGDPRVLGSGDADHDGIDAACDPNDNLGESNNDYDQDGYLNRQDNCPLVANGIGQKDVPGVGNQLDTDRDGIGDACDVLGAPIRFPDGTTGQGLGPNVPDGHFHEVCRDASVTVGAGGATVPAVDPRTVLPCSAEGATQANGELSAHGPPLGVSTPIWVAIAAGLGAVVSLGALGWLIRARRSRRQSR